MQLGPQNCNNIINIIVIVKIENITKKSIRDNYKELIDGKFNDCTSVILRKNLEAEDGPDSKTNVVEEN